MKLLKTCPKHFNIIFRSTYLISNLIIFFLANCNVIAKVLMLFVRNLQIDNHLSCLAFFTRRKRGSSLACSNPCCTGSKRHCQNLRKRHDAFTEESGRKFVISVNFLSISKIVVHDSYPKFAYLPPEHIYLLFFFPKIRKSSRIIRNK